MLHLHFYQIKTEWSLLLHEDSKVCLYVCIGNSVIGVMHCVNMHGSKLLKNERLIFYNGLAHILVVSHLPIFSQFFGVPRGEKQDFHDSLANAKK